MQYSVSPSVIGVKMFICDFHLLRGTIVFLWKGGGTSAVKKRLKGILV